MDPQLSYASQTEPVVPTPAPRNFFSRLSGVYFAPGETFQEIGRAPRPLLPVILMMIMAALSAYLLTNRYGYERIVRSQIETMAAKGWVPQDKAEEIIQQSLSPSAVTRGKIQGAIMPMLILLVVLLAAAGLIKLLSMMVGAENTYKQLLAVTAYSFLAVGLLHFLILLITIYLKDPAEIDLYNPVGSNLGALLSLSGVQLPKYLAALASFVDVFSIWRLVLLAIGYAAVSRKLKVGTAGVFVGILYVIAALLGAAATAMFA